MKSSAIGTIVIMIIAGAMLITLAPDTLSIIVVVLMCTAIAAGLAIGIVPMILCSIGFKNARNTIKEVQGVASAESWLTIFKNDSLFRNKMLDKIFAEYKAKVEEQKDNDEIESDIDEYISEDTLYVRTWQGLVLQIPGTLTGLGILGTFIGLITGISGIGFSSVEATIESVAVLLNGIELAFYTSIAGVILSIAFNIINRISWNTLLREHGYFIEIFHKEVIPSTEEQERIKNQLNMKKIITRLDRLPKPNDFSLPSEFGNTVFDPLKEQKIMPQIRDGISHGEFVFYIQPKINLATRKICGGEALVRWNHKTLGLLMPATFVPILEHNGYIVRLDSYIWEKVCRQIREWIDAGKRPVPISVNISKIDILVMDVVAFFESMLAKYKIPPRSLELEIAKNAYVQNPGITKEAAGALRRLGFKIIMDGFDGDFISINMLEGTEVDSLNLDMRYMSNADDTMIEEIFEKARKLNVELTVSSVENAEQLSLTTRNGCTTGQGYYFNKPMRAEEFETLSGQE